MAAVRAAAWLLGAVAVVSPSSAAAEPLAVLDVPFLSQSELLCGGAAAAMVLRYWGASVAPEDFSPLVDEKAGGIRGDALTRAVQDLGWGAYTLRGDERGVRHHLARGRPIVALIEDRPGRYHYVVLLAWPAGHVILHDPARAPFRVVTADAFTSRWRAAGSWMLLIIPGEGIPDGRLEQPPRASVPASHDPCRALVSQGVRLGRAGELEAADGALAAAFTLCSDSASPPRELAGVRFLQSRWDEAARLAELATARAPDDEHAWRLLASSHFMRGDTARALAAWNRVGEPRLDDVRVQGLGRTRQAIVEALLDLKPGELLTPDRLRRAERRLTLLPAQAESRVRYRPIPGGLAAVDAAIVERSRGPGPLQTAVLSMHALTHRELLVDLTAPADAATRWSGAWRWWRTRPRVAMSLTAPAAFGRAGLWRLDGVWERQTYGLQREEAATLETLAATQVSYSDWVSPDTRVTVGLGLERWNRSRLHAPISGAVERRLAGDRLATRAGGSVRPSFGRGAASGAGRLDLVWRSSTGDGPAMVIGRAGLEAVTSRAPLGIWPGAGTGQARRVLARAHPLLDGGIVAGDFLGRMLAHGGLEVQATRSVAGPVRAGVAVFGDVARATRTFDGIPGRTHVDVGFGLRARLASRGPTLRVDLARGLADGRTAVSAGWLLPWPGE